MMLMIYYDDDEQIKIERDWNMKSSNETMNRIFKIHVSIMLI